MMWFWMMISWFGCTSPVDVQPPEVIAFNADQPAARQQRTGRSCVVKRFISCTGGGLGPNVRMLDDCLEACAKDGSRSDCVGAAFAFDEEQHSAESFEIVRATLAPLCGPSDPDTCVALARLSHEPEPLEIGCDAGWAAACLERASYDHASYWGTRACVIGGGRACDGALFAAHRERNHPQRYELLRGLAALYPDRYQADLDTMERDGLGLTFDVVPVIHGGLGPPVRGVWTAPGTAGSVALGDASAGWGGVGILGPEGLWAVGTGLAGKPSVAWVNEDGVVERSKWIGGRWYRGVYPAQSHSVQSTLSLTEQPTLLDGFQGFTARSGGWSSWDSPVAPAARLGRHSSERLQTTYLPSTATTSAVFASFRRDRLEVFVGSPLGWTEVPVPQNRPGPPVENRSHPVVGHGEDGTVVVAWTGIEPSGRGRLFIRSYQVDRGWSDVGSIPIHGRRMQGYRPRVDPQYALQVAVSPTGGAALVSMTPSATQVFSFEAGKITPEGTLPGGRWPALAFEGKRLLLAWAGPNLWDSDDDPGPRILWTQRIDGAWRAPRIVRRTQAEVSPRLVPSSEGILLGWRTGRQLQLLALGADDTWRTLGSAPKRRTLTPGWHGVRSPRITMFAGNLLVGFVSESSVQGHGGIHLWRMDVDGIQHSFEVPSPVPTHWGLGGQSALRLFSFARYPHTGEVYEHHPPDDWQNSPLPGPVTTHQEVFQTGRETRMLADWIRTGDRHVYRWQGIQWVDIGQHPGNTDGVLFALQDQLGVAYIELTASKYRAVHVQVKQAGGWQPLGDPGPVCHTKTGDARDLSVVAHEAKVWLTWRDRGTVSACEWTGSEWRLLASPTDDGDDTALSLLDGQPVLWRRKHTAQSGRIDARRWDGQRWRSLGAADGTVVDGCKPACDEMHVAGGCVVWLEAGRLGDEVALRCFQSADRAEAAWL